MTRRALYAIVQCEEDSTMKWMPDRMFKLLAACLAVLLAVWALNELAETFGSENIFALLDALVRGHALPDE